MEKLFLLKKGNMKFFTCRYDCGMYTIERNNKCFGGIVATFQTLEDLERYAKQNGYKRI